jgi:hypothetical protein
LTTPQVDLPSPGETCATFSHGPGPDVPSQGIPSTMVGGRGYSLFTTEAAQRSGTGLVSGILAIFREAARAVKPLANGMVAGVPHAIESSRQMHSFMAPDTAELLGHEGESGSLDSPVVLGGTMDSNMTILGITLGHYGGEGGADMIYARKSPVQANHCISLCELLTPEETARVNEIETICVDDDGDPSCDPNDYAVVREEPCTAPWELDPTDPGYSEKPEDCHWDKWLCACHYYTCDLAEPGCEQSCETDPLCEGNLCSYEALHIPRDACTEDRQYCPEKSCFGSITGQNPCTGDTGNVSAPRCHVELFEPNENFADDGTGIIPYGPCFYTSPDVCMQNGTDVHSNLSDCNNVCNYQCCQ